MPGLLRGVARTAAIAGTATAVSGRVQRRQAQKFAEQDQTIAANQGAGYYQGYQQAAAQPPAASPQPVPVPAAPVAAAPPAMDPIAALKDLAELKQQGFLTDEEFAAQKARVLGSM
ncbi:MAG: SHOCT domain-containing protein [Candidatus Nanopelagicales bacterium]